MNIYKKFARDIERDIKNNENHKKKLVLLSGGVDSLLLLAAAVKLYPKEQIETFTFYGDETYDYQKAIDTAKYFGVKNRLYRFDYETLKNNILELKSTGLPIYKKLFDAMEIAIFQAFTKEISNSDIIWGEGADDLYGSTTAYIFINTNKVAKDFNLTPNEARNKIKKDWYKNTRNLPVLPILLPLLRANNNNVITPYLNPKLEYVNNLDFKTLSPSTKAFPRKVLLDIYKLPLDLIKRKRTFLQDGLGYYFRLKEEFKNKIEVQPLEGL